MTARSSKRGGDDHDAAPPPAAACPFDAAFPGGFALAFEVEFPPAVQEQEAEKETGGARGSGHGLDHADTKAQRRRSPAEWSSSAQSSSSSRAGRGRQSSRLARRCTPNSPCQPLAPATHGKSVYTAAAERARFCCRAARRASRCAAVSFPPVSLFSPDCACCLTPAFPLPSSVASLFAPPDSAGALLRLV
eukprot:COSAG05_NODE_6901_length_884_cov_48.416073_1_plen_190_part_10